MVKLSLHLLPGKCKVPGCDRAAGMFGICSVHEEGHIDSHFEQAVSDGACSADAPPCFRSMSEYKDYVVSFSLARSHEAAKIYRVDFCRDCNPVYKAKMMFEERCSHRETVFIKSHRLGGDVVGVSVDDVKKSTASWENAMMGMSGEVMCLPPHDAIADTLAQIDKEAQPKKRGPRFKKDRT
ncbi:hypothetical protein UFOVP1298_22 [uncultured Caudovirales phage]|uniref:Uncharacterized protein n=1 Tax=uncultured Caudovirales phage TaxID=2100421 RepID=A0A6J5REL4_9CAUD|nr:hypothetical protein UFOVP1298_22 [uncultured Caudovirales phage]